MAARVNRVGVRELRQNLSKYLVRVQRGETLEVTDHGRPVAVLGPLPQSDSLIDRMIAEGRARPPLRPWKPTMPPKQRGGGISISEALEEQREERR